MDCEHFDQIVMDLLYAELADDEQVAAAKRHTERCERCAGVFSGLRATRKMAILPVLEPSGGFDDKIMEAARNAQHHVPWPRKIGRWVSWAGSYAMRPQLAMAALLLLMIGSSLLLLRGRPGYEQVGVVRVTEQGVPEREPTQGSARAPSEELPASPASEFERPAGRAQPAVGDEAVARSGPPAKSAARDGTSEGETRTDQVEQQPSEVALGAAPSAAPYGNVQRAAEPEAPPDSDYARAMALYNSRDYPGAYRAFDAIAMRGGPSAAPAALHAAKAVRASAGCATALPRFESVVARYSSTGAGVAAKWEVATCARLLGQYSRARQLYAELAQVEGHRDRAQRELSRMSSEPAAAPPAAAKPSDQDSRSRAKRAADEQNNAY